MSTKIHAVFQKKNENSWSDVASRYNEKVHYLLYAVLANIQNDHGFAGIAGTDPIKCISNPRGLPEDFICNENVHCNKYIGNHDYTWLLGSEIIDFPDQEIYKTGILTIEDYRKWDKSSYPSGVITYISGNVMVSKPHHIFKGTTHVRIQWKSTVNNEIKYFIEEVKRLVALHGEIRVVFGFEA